MQCVLVLSSPWKHCTSGCDSYSQATLPGSIEPLLVDLIPGGSKVPVTPDRVQEYVR